MSLNANFADAKVLFFTTQRMLRTTSDVTFEYTSKTHATARVYVDVDRAGFTLYLRYRQGTSGDWTTVSGPSTASRFSGRSSRTFNVPSVPYDTPYQYQASGYSDFRGATTSTFEATLPVLSLSVPQATVTDTTAKVQLFVRNLQVLLFESPQTVYLHYRVKGETAWIDEPSQSATSAMPTVVFDIDDLMRATDYEFQVARDAAFTGATIHTFRTTIPAGTIDAGVETDLVDLENVPLNVATTVTITATATLEWLEGPRAGTVNAGTVTLKMGPPVFAQALLRLTRFSEGNPSLSCALTPGIQRESSVHATGEALMRLLLVSRIPPIRVPFSSPEVTEEVNGSITPVDLQALNPDTNTLVANWRTSDYNLGGLSPKLSIPTSVTNAVITLSNFRFTGVENGSFEAKLYDKDDAQITLSGGNNALKYTMSVSRGVLSIITQQSTFEYESNPFVPQGEGLFNVGGRYYLSRDERLLSREWGVGSFPYIEFSARDAALDRVRRIELCWS